MKRFLFVILAVINVFTTTVGAESTMPDEKQRKDLYELGIMVGDQTGNLRLEDTITRAEIVKMICVAGHLTPKNIGSETDMFPDVSKDHWAYSYIYTAKDNGIISGDENGLFHAENKVTNEEVIKMIVSLLGYDVMADMKGGYPSGYAAEATRLGITVGMQFDINTPAIRKHVAIMISRALDVPLLIQKSAENEEDGSVSYVVADGYRDIPRMTLRNAVGLQE